MAFPSEMMRARRRPPVTAAAWLASLPLAGLAGARIVGYDNHPALAAANGATPLVYLPAYGALAVGVSRRNRALTTLAASLVAVHAVWVAPELPRRRRIEAEAKTGHRLRVVSANARFNNRRRSALGRELARWEADFLLLQELTPDQLVPLKESGAFDRFPYSYVDARQGSFGAGIWSRYPLSESETWTPAGHPVVRAVADVKGTPVRLFNVHVKAPSGRWAIPFWKAQLRALGIAAHGDLRPVIIAGDFNATYGHRPFRDLLATGLREAHMEVGRGLACTWPRNARVLPPFYRLDHVLVSPDLVVLDAREGDGKGSDHRPVVVDLALPQTEGLG
jgi:endonuclease/exonuclease/phosphatase (EEP) superfamily protein YafD